MKQVKGEKEEEKGDLIGKGTTTITRAPTSEPSDHKSMVV